MNQLRFPREEEREKTNLQVSVREPSLVGDVDLLESLLDEKSLEQPLSISHLVALPTSVLLETRDVEVVVHLCVRSSEDSDGLFHRDPIAHLERVSDE